MQLSEIITKAIPRFPSEAALARHLGVAPTLLNDAKKGKRPLPLAACGRLAEIVGMDRYDVAAASDLLTEKNEQRRAYLLPFVRHAAGIMGLAVMAGTALPHDANAAQPRTFERPALPNTVYYVK